MRAMRVRFVVAAAAAMLTSMIIGAVPTAAQTVPSFTCHGGSIPAGTYSSVQVNGFCTIDAGTVHVVNGLVVGPNAGLLAAFGGSDLHVGGNLVAQSGAILVLGCEPEAFVCFNDPDQNVGTLSTHHTVGGSLVGNGALMMLVHHNAITQSLTQSGGGGGVTCDNFPLGPDGPPAYSAYEDNTIGGAAVVSGVHTCWLGFIRNTVMGNVTYSGNVTADPDGNEIVTNTIHQNLVCSGNSPAPQVGDSQGATNVVFGSKVGQCSTL
jgi:hypothetical protein